MSELQRLSEACEDYDGAEDRQEAADKVLCACAQYLNEDESKIRLDVKRFVELWLEGDWWLIGVRIDGFFDLAKKEDVMIAYLNPTMKTLNYFCAVKDLPATLEHLIAYYAEAGLITRE